MPDTILSSVISCGASTVTSSVTGACCPLVLSKPVPCTIPVNVSVCSVMFENCSYSVLPVAVPVT